MQCENDSDSADWVFAYGSLIWRPDFDSDEVQQARLDGFERRFWQASHDHRGTPDLPGRVVTLAPIMSGFCDGLAYRLPTADRTSILQRLDEREQDGYQRVYLNLHIADGQSVKALTWIAVEGNPSWVGQESEDLLAELIATRHGPSGSNREYLYRLNEALGDFKILDTYIASLTDRVEKFRQG